MNDTTENDTTENDTTETDTTPTYAEVLPIPESADWIGYFPPAFACWLAAVAPPPGSSAPLWLSLFNVASLGGWSRASGGERSVAEARDLLRAAVQLADLAGAPAGDRLEVCAVDGATAYTTCTGTSVVLIPLWLGGAPAVVVTGADPVSVLRRALDAAVAGGLDYAPSPETWSAALALSAERAADKARRDLEERASDVSPGRRRPYTAEAEDADGGTTPANPYSDLPYGAQT